MNMPVDMHEEVLNFFFFLVGSRDNTWITSVIDDDAKMPFFFFPSSSFPLLFSHHQ